MWGSRSFREGSVGLFALLGLVLLGGIAIWLRGGGFGQKTYQFTVKFSDVSGLQVGAPVRFRGLTVGKIAAFKPQLDGVEATLEIASAKLLIPSNSAIAASRYGLIGEGSIDITPAATLSEQQMASLSPFPPECNPKTATIICDGQQVTGETGSQLVSSLTNLGKSLSELDINNVNAAVGDIRLATVRLAKLSQELFLLANLTRQQIKGAPKAIQSIERTADNAAKLTENLNSLVLENQGNLNRTLTDASELMASLNQTVNENRGNLSRTLANVEKTSQELGVLAVGLQTTVGEVNTTLAAADKEKIVKDLEVAIADTAEIAKNLRNVSEKLGDPATILTLQQTLDSARATFENVQKITADVDELTGDPNFRTKLRRLIDGLSTLVSSGQEMERQVQTAQVLDVMSQQLEYQIITYQQLAALQAQTQKNKNHPPDAPTSSQVPEQEALSNEKVKNK